MSADKSPRDTNPRAKAELTKTKPTTAIVPRIQGYPTIIRLSDGAETYLSQLATDLELGRVEYAQLSPALRELYSFGFEAGRESQAGEIASLNYTADRLYAEVCRRTPPKMPDLTSYERTEEIRKEIYYSAVTA